MENKVYAKFEEYMKELFRLPSGELPSIINICKEANIDRNFYYRVKNNDFKGAPAHSKNVSALCNAIAIKESLKKKVTAQEVLDGLINAKLLPEGSRLETEMDIKEAETVSKHLEEFAEYAKGKSSKDFGLWK